MSQDTDSSRSSRPASEFPAPIPSHEVEPRLRAAKRDIDAWIEARTDQYDPFNWNDLEKRAVRRKAICEASIYLHVAESLDDLATPNLKELLVERVNDSRYYRLLARKPHEIHKFGYPIAYVATHDDLADDAARTMERTLGRPSVLGLERKPFRTLDIWHLCQMYGYENHGIDFDSVIHLSCGSRLFSPIESSRENAYEFTHIILYAHNFGSGNERFPTDPLQYGYPETLEGLLLRYLAEEDTDLVGEMLFCGVLEDLLPPGLVEFGLAWLLEQIDDEGYVPGPHDSLPVGETKDSPELEDLDMGDWDDESEEWGKNYHPTMVAGMIVRVIADRWEEIDRPGRRRDFDYEAHGEHLIELGQLFWTLGGYDLEAGAKTFRELVETPAVDAFPELFRLTAEFFEYQRRPDGEFGYWTDEKQVYLSMDPDHTEESFREEMLRPTTEACRDALDAFEARTRTDVTVG